MLFMVIRFFFLVEVPVQSQEQRPAEGRSPVDTRTCAEKVPVMVLSWKVPTEREVSLCDMFGVNVRCPPPGSLKLLAPCTFLNLSVLFSVLTPWFHVLF